MQWQAEWCCVSGTAIGSDDKGNRAPAGPVGIEQRRIGEDTAPGATGPAGLGTAALVRARIGRKKRSRKQDETGDEANSKDSHRRTHLSALTEQMTETTGGGMPCRTCSNMTTSR